MQALANASPAGERLLRIFLTKATGRTNESSLIGREHRVGIASLSRAEPGKMVTPRPLAAIAAAVIM